MSRLHILRAVLLRAVLLRAVPVSIAGITVAAALATTAPASAALSTAHGSAGIAATATGRTPARGQVLPADRRVAPTSVNDSVLTSVSCATAS